MAEPETIIHTAVVRNGRLTLDEPTDLPEGEVIELVPADRDDLDDEERAKLHDALERAWQQEKAGEGRSAQEFIDSL